MWAKLRNLLKPVSDHTEAQQAIQDASNSLIEAVSKDREVQQVVASLRYHRDVNHFAERIRASLVEGH